MLSLKVFLTDRLTAAAEEIFGAVEKTIEEYKEDILRSKDLEINRLRLQLKLLKSAPRSERYGTQQQHHHHHHSSNPPPPHQQQQHHHPSIPPAVPAAGEAPCPEPPPQHHCDQEEEDGNTSSMDEEHPEPSQIKKEHHKSQQQSSRHFWLSQDDEQLDGLESDIKEFISPSTGLKGGSLQDSGVLPFHAYPSNSSGDENKEKPYCCSVCEKRFGNCSHLAAHIRTHTGERPYRCDICRKTFITTSALNRHQTIHTEGKQFICNYCGKSFKWMESLGRHIRSVHKRETNMPI